MIFLREATCQSKKTHRQSVFFLHRRYWLRRVGLWEGLLSLSAFSFFGSRVGPGAPSSLETGSYWQIKEQFESFTLCLCVSYQEILLLYQSYLAKADRPKRKQNPTRHTFLEANMRLWDTHSYLGCIITFSSIKILWCKSMANAATYHINITNIQTVVGINIWHWHLCPCKKSVSFLEPRPKNVLIPT